MGNGILMGEKKVLKKYKEFDGIEIFDTTNLGKFSNVVSVNHNVLINYKCPIEMEIKLENLGFKTHRTKNTEFCKIDGDITCRSLII